jgi:lipid-A-disaccharide synthase
MDRDLRILIVAGEASGDTHAARLVTAIREARPTVLTDFFGSAGPNMRSVGVEAVVEADNLSVVGLAEIGRALPMFVKTLTRLRTAAAERRPDVAVLVDFPDFNLRLAKHLHRLGIKVVYYISPQLWAWRKYRISTIKKYIDLMLTILPFEKDWYADHGVTHVEYVGNPLAREVHAKRAKEEFCMDQGLDPAQPIIALLPGSRRKEVTRILPVMLEAAARLAGEKPGTQFVVPIANERLRASVESMVTSAGLDVRVVNGVAYDALNASDAAAVTSGTATLEAGILRTPMVVVYKTSKVNYKLLEPMIDVPHYGLINLIAGRRLATELIQEALTAETLKDELARLLDPKANAEMREELSATTAKLGKGGASKRAARLILDIAESGSCGTNSED